MLGKISGNPRKVLEPHAGKGDIVEALRSRYEYRHCGTPDICAIEIDPDLQATLRGKSIKLIDTNFLAYSAHDKFDLIIANPPFEDGDKHLLKAIDMLFRGQIIFLLNAETLRNPFSNSRKLLVRKLEELGAEIEYIPNAFVAAERKTLVEVALVNIKIDRKVEDDLFADADDHASRCHQTVKDKHEVSTGKTIEELVGEYDETIQVGTATILGFYRNYKKVGRYLKLNDIGAKDRNYSSDDLTTMMQDAINTLLVTVRTAFWCRTLDLKEVRSRLTKKKQGEFEHALTENCFMDFTESNIRQFVINLIGGFEKTLTDAVIDIFDMFTIRHCYEDGVDHKNVHYFTGWRSNSSFKVNHRVVIPIGYRGSYDGPFTDFRGDWSLNYSAADTLRDIDIVMNSLDGGKPGYITISDAIRHAFSQGISSGIESTYFKITTHKKGTAHLTFRSEDILRRFNVVACRGKGWLPGSFGTKPYSQLTFEERQVVNSFEDEKTYDKNVNVSLFGNTSPILSLPGCVVESDDLKEAA
jgi:hypothetical protein